MEPAADPNPEGYWENRKFVGINNKLLAALGGGWDFAPTSGLETLEPDKLRRVTEQAVLLLREFEGREPWGWKDPRNSLLAPFWLSIIPELRFVICLRNPLDVAASLYRRNDFSLPMSLALWKDYNERLLACTRPESRVITHYDAFFGDSERELNKLVAFLGLPMQGKAVQESLVATRTDLRHSRAYLHQLLDSGIPRDVFDLYMAMCDEAGWHEGGGHAALDKPVEPDLLQTGTSTATERIGSRDLQQQLAASIQAEIGTIRQDQARLDALGAERDALRAELDARESELAWLRAELQRRTRDYAAVLCSTSWRITAPLRSWSLSERFRRIARG